MEKSGLGAACGPATAVGSLTSAQPGFPCPAAASVSSMLVHWQMALPSDYNGSRLPILGSSAAGGSPTGLGAQQ